MFPLLYPAAILLFLFSYRKLVTENEITRFAYQNNQDEMSIDNPLSENTTKTPKRYYAVLIRAVNPTISQMNRYQKWRSQLPSYYDMHLLLSSPYINSTKLFNSTTIIPLGEVKRKYPKLEEMAKRCRGIRSILWITHTESIIMWYKRLKQIYTYIWIIEQDIGVTGNIYSIMSKYEDSNYDLITFGLVKQTYKWRWSICVTQEYQNFRSKHSPKGGLYTCREYFQRWSQSLFSIFEKNLALGMHAASEASIPETAIYSKLKVGIIPKENVGIAFCGKSFNKTQWYKFRSNPSLQNKIFHPLKF